jgi:Acetyltransferase (GNAT) family
LLARLEQWALSAGVRRLELMVMTHNQAAIGLYRKLATSAREPVAPLWSSTASPSTSCGWRSSFPASSGDHERERPEPSRFGVAVGAAPAVAVSAGAAAAVAFAIAHLLHERRSFTRACASMDVLYPSGAALENGLIATPTRFAAVR